MCLSLFFKCSGDYQGQNTFQYDGIPMCRAMFIEVDFVHFATPRKPPCGCMCPHGPTLFSSYAEKLAEKHALRSCPIGWRPSKSARPLAPVPDAAPAPKRA